MRIPLFNRPTPFLDLLDDIRHDLRPNLFSQGRNTRKSRRITRSSLRKKNRSKRRRAKTKTTKVYIPKRYKDEGLTVSDFACVVTEDGKKVAKYPLKSTSKKKTKKRIKNAMARYNQETTVKCDPKGMKKICSAYKREGLTHTEAYRKNCL